ncbi:MAG: hypothetical protein Kow001_02150 [Acidobacteriota bacterium]
MRKTIFRWIALTSTACLLVIALVALSASRPTVAAAAEADGQKIFMADKCNMCHDVSTVGIKATVKSEKMKGPDLVNLDKDADWIAKFLKKEVDLNGKKHNKVFGGSADDLKTLAAWIAAQKK